MNAGQHSDSKPLIEEHRVETYPERVPMKRLDEHVVHTVILATRYF